MLARPHFYGNLGQTYLNLLSETELPAQKFGFNSGTKTTWSLIKGRNKWCHFKQWQVMTPQTKKCQCGLHGGCSSTPDCCQINKLTFWSCLYQVHVLILHAWFFCMVLVVVEYRIIILANWATQSCLVYMWRAVLFIWIGKLQCNRATIINISLLPNNKGSSTQVWLPINPLCMLQHYQSESFVYFRLWRNHFYCAAFRSCGKTSFL